LEGIQKNARKSIGTLRGIGKGVALGMDVRRRKSLERRWMT